MRCYLLFVGFLCGALKARKYLILVKLMWYLFISGEDHRHSGVGSDHRGSPCSAERNPEKRDAKSQTLS